MKPKLLVSVSGGQTSGYMATRIVNDWQDRFDLKFVFANTGAENEETLIFVDRLSKSLNVEIVWVEAVVHEGRRGCTHRIVDFNSASRNCEPFEAMIEKYGIPNKAYPHCTRELKLNPIRSYMKSIGWRDYLTAVGIRSDEKSRVRKNKRIIYPLVTEWPTTKVDVNWYWEQQDFQLGLPDYRGNCRFCWKKSFAKLIRIAAEKPNDFDFPMRMESTRGLNGHNIDGNPRVFFRENRSAKDILTMAVGVTNFPPIRKDENSGCSESCEAFS